MGSKTPVSILQEMMARLGNPPKYDLIYDGGGTHEALFKYRVYADRVTAIGTGRSKKEAKQEAARNALERLAQNQIGDSEQPVPKESIEVESPYKDQLQENAVGALHDFCSLYDIPLPEYELTHVEGPPHARIFTFLCSISKQKEYGVGRTKKQAKQLAANNMLARMKQSLSGLVEMEETTLQPQPPDAEAAGDHAQPSEECKQAIARYLECAPSPRKKVKLNKCPAQYHRCLESAPPEAGALLHAMHLPTLHALMQCYGMDDVGEDDLEAPQHSVASLCDLDWPSELAKVAEMLQLEVSFSNLPSRKRNRVIMTVSVSTVPEIVAPGFGKDLEEAKQAAALMCLLQLQVLTRPGRGGGAAVAASGCGASSGESGSGVRADAAPTETPVQG